MLTPGGPWTRTTKGGGSSTGRSAMGTCSRRCSFSALRVFSRLLRAAEEKMKACREPSRQPPPPRMALTRSRLSVGFLHREASLLLVDQLLLICRQRRNERARPLVSRLRSKTQHAPAFGPATRAR